MLYYYALLYYNINLKQIKTMKKIHLISTLIGLLAFSTLAKADLKVVTSIKPIHSLASYIMDGVGSPGLIVDGYNSPHSFQLKPSHAKMLEQADIIFWIGEDLENFLEKPLNSIAKKRGQSLSQMALAWTLNNKAVTSALIGVRNLKQLKENVESLKNLNFSKKELLLINKKAKDGGINLWLPSSSH